MRAHAEPSAATDTTPLGIIAGGGELPRLIVQNCRGSGRACFVLGLDGETDPATMNNVPHFWGRLEKIGKAIEALQEAGVRELVLAGRVGRESLRPRIPDAKALKLMARIAAASRNGDNALFSSIVDYLEDEGFRVRGVQEVMGDILAQQGLLAGKKPDKASEEDVALGVEVLRRLGDMDVGQAVIVQKGRVVGIEGAEGTDGLIMRCAPFLAPGEGGVLVKIKKADQDERVDLPAIGPGTVENIAKVGLRGVAVQAGKTLVIHRETLVQRAEELGVFVTGITL